jgi:hypothetical protein
VRGRRSALDLGGVARVGGGAATTSGTVGALERAGRRPLAVGVGRSEAGVEVARVGEARRPVWRSRADAASGGAARDCEWGNGEAVWGRRTPRAEEPHSPARRDWRSDAGRVAEWRHGATPRACELRGDRDREEGGAGRVGEGDGGCGIGDFGMGVKP